MSLKTTGWTNKEVMGILEGRKIHLENMDAEDKNLDWARAYNDGIDQCISRFYDFDQDPETAHCAMAYDTETGQIFVTSKPLPQ